MGDILVTGYAIIASAYPSYEIHMRRMVHFHCFYVFPFTIDCVYVFKNMAPFPQAHHWKGGLHMLVSQDMKNQGKNSVGLGLEKVYESLTDMALHTVTPGAVVADLPGIIIDIHLMAAVAEPWAACDFYAGKANRCHDRHNS